LITSNVVVVVLSGLIKVSLPTTTAVAPFAPVITSPLFKQTCVSPPIWRAEAVELPPTFVVISNVPLGELYTILDAGVQYELISTPSKNG